MMTTKIFRYHQRHRVILLDTSGDYFSRRYRQVYTKNLIAHRGTDNRILIEFVNQDQKRVDLRSKTIADAATTAGSFVVGNDYKIVATGDTDFSLIGAKYNFRIGDIFTATGAGNGTGTAALVTYTDLEFTCRVISHDGEKLLLEKPLEIVNRTQGQTNLILTEEELDSIIPSKVGFSIEQTSDGNLYEPVYIDANAGARGIIDVVDSIMPSFVASGVLTIPTPTTASYKSSTLTTNAAELHTFQITMNSFTGTIETNGATDTDGNWYTIATDAVAESNMYVLTITGYHPYVQFTFAEANWIAVDLITVGNEYTILSPGTTDFTLLGASDSLPGTVFVATALGVGTGTVTTSDPGFPGTITEIQHR